MSVWCLSPCVSVCQPKCSSIKLSQPIFVYIMCMCLCVIGCVCLSQCSVCVPLILRSSPIHPLILLTYSPNPVIPGSLFFHPVLYPFIPLSRYLSPASTAPLSLHPPLQPSSLLLPLPPSNHLSYSPSIPLDSVIASLSRCLKSWHHGFFSRRVQSLPYEKCGASNCTLISAN